MKSVWKSVELRWFFRDAPSWMAKLFDALPPEHYFEEEREDLYLEIGSETAGIKLRHGRLEVKTRSGYPGGCELQGISGWLEHWEKRGFQLGEAEAPIHRREGWISVQKHRRATLCGPGPHGFQCQPPTPGAPTSCQVEVTALRIGRASLDAIASADTSADSMSYTTWYTFGLEWPQDGIPGYPHYTEWLPGVLGHLGVPGLPDTDFQESGLEESNSMGYPAFLAKWSSGEIRL